MTRKRTERRSRRRFLKGLGLTGSVALAGCTSGGDNGGGGGGDGGNGTPTTTSDVDLPTEEEGVAEWGERLNEHAREAGIEWDQFEGEGIELTFGMGLHPYSTTTEAVLPYFEDLTGISVEYQKFAEDQYWLEAETYVGDESGRFDGIMVGLWPAGGYHYGDGNGGWVRDLNEFIGKSYLTDQDWLSMDDFRNDTIELMTFPNRDLGTTSFVGFPNGIEAYGCPAIDVPTFEKLGIDQNIENVQQLEEAAKQISESDDVDREGFVSRTSSTTLSSANWGTMFKTYGADWIDRENKEAALNSEKGIASLERFGRMVNQYGAEDPGTRDWYKNNNTFSRGDVGIMYSTPQTSGIISPQQARRTKFLPPVKGPNGEDPVVDTWIWSTGISKFSENPEAAWLFIQWANSREANYMLSTRQWQGDQPRAGYARWDYIFERNKNDSETPDPPDGYENAFREGMAGVPVDPPPVPVDTPQNMNIMSEAAGAMSSVCSGDRTAEKALNDVAPDVTEFAQRIPDRYINFTRSKT